jgi:SulP family sulfate permease
VRRSPFRADRIVLLVTFGLTVFVDLVVAVNVGVVIAALLFMRRMAESVSVQQEVFGGVEAAGDAGDATPVVPPGVLVYRIDGPFFFGAAEKLEATVERAQLHVESVVIRLGRVPFMDATGMHTLSEIIERFHRRGIRVLLVEIQARLERSLARAGVLDLVGPRNVQPDLDAAVRALEGRGP